MIKNIKNFFHGLTETMPLQDFGNYNEYWIKRGFGQHSLHRAKTISPYIKSGAKILDVGCGDGTMIEYLQKNNSPKFVLGIDISSAAVEHIQSKGFEAKVMDATSDEFVKFLEKEKFDYIIITEVLEHVIDPEKIINACKKSFNERIFITIPNAGFLTHRIRLLLGRFPVVIIQQHVKEHVRFWTIDDFLYWIKFHGLCVKKYTSLWNGGGELLGRLFPKLFGIQILYIVGKCTRKKKIQ